ncbi:molybdopterin-dependent oxidoreductase [Pseudonocardia yunnanensis]|uniref:Molybdopterin-dependent oxidoreductase n=1 Tax=Pseudonocardia yunnanensis TaxID=58107 RepID=A0ABW4EVA2_9PSEU
MSTTAAPTRPARPSIPGIPRVAAGMIGGLAVGAALASGHLVAALTSPSSSPFLAVGDTVIRFSPQPLTEFAKTTLGTADKPVLLGGIAVVLAILAVLTGLLARRRPGPGVSVVVVLGLLGLGAVTLAPAYAPRDLAAPCVALAVGVAVFGVLHALARRTYSPTAPETGRVQVTRRSVLVGTSAAVAVASLASAGAGQFLGRGVEDSRRRVTERLARLRLAERAPAIPPGSAFPELGTPTFLTSNRDFYRIDVALRIPAQRAEDWALRIHGMVENELTLTFDDLLARPLVERTITMTCVSNPVGGDLVSTANFIGVDLRRVLLDAGVRPGADQIFATSVDGWYTGTPTDVVLEEGRGALLAVGMNGEALPPEHGFPVRMVVPGLYGYVSATKWLTDLELTTFGAESGYWLERGWAQKAPIKTQCRIDVPRGFATVPAGRVTVAGIAWSQPTGISRVEVRMDGGPWKEAGLADEVNPRTWRMWRAEFELAPGSHTVQTRATDRNGNTQTEMRADPIPDGASGWPATIFTAA